MTHDAGTAAPARSPDLGSAILLDHVNLRVTDQQRATAFFVEGLGLARDPERMTGTGNMWVHVGRQQLHLPTGEPRRFAGEIGLCLPRPGAAAGALAARAGRFAGTPFAVEGDGATARVVDPWGRRFRLHPASGEPPGAGPPAIPYVTFWVRPGTAAGIAAFYEQVLEAPAHPLAPPEAGVAVRVGPGMALRYLERDDVEPSGHALHVCLYVTRFHAIHRRLERMGAVSEPMAREQFRFHDITAPEGGTVLYSIEHEIRSLYHRYYGWPLHDRVPAPGAGGPGAPG